MTPTARRAPLPVRVLFVVCASACAPIATAGPDCRPVGEVVILPESLDETSGAAVGRRAPGVVWTHGDGPGTLYSVDAAGTATREYRFSFRFRDLEDVEIGACGDGRSCLYLADTGDNFLRRPAGNARIARLLEPGSGDVDEPQLDIFPVAFPDGPRDVEALFVLPGERVYLVSKGRAHALSVYRYPLPLRPDTVTLVEVQRLSDGPMPLLAQVTGASASPDGELVAIRTYQSLQFFRVEADTLVPEPGGFVNLRSLEEIQGEGVGFGPDGVLVLTSEGGPLGGSPSMRWLQCALSDG